MILTVAYEVKLTFAFAVVLLLLFLGFIIFVILLYNKNQINHIKESQIKDIEHKNILLQKEIEKHKSLQSERQRISNDMHDDIGAGLSAIKLQSEILKHNIDNNSISKAEIDELIRISEEINLSMREILWSLNASNDNVRKMLDYCKNYIESYLSKTKIQFTQHQDIENPDTIVSAELRRNVLLIVKEACHNIVKHSQATRVIFDVVEGQHFIRISIQDNGIGIQQARVDGYGLTTMQSRAESVGGNFNICKETEGTKINISFNLSKD
ncbi:histidine kinase [Soonwooa sp.]|uniref:sensor histidine kinase n=1 Tax=Soonwooa sp. TaxID=1938592 RepID=UPI0028AF250C|nr:histidine kinase [Soonwooa sp.]